MPGCRGLRETSEVARVPLKPSLGAPNREPGFYSKCVRKFALSFKQTNVVCCVFQRSLWGAEWRTGGAGGRELRPSEEGEMAAVGTEVVTMDMGVHGSETHFRDRMNGTQVKGIPEEPWDSGASGGVGGGVLSCGGVLGDGGEHRLGEETQGSGAPGSIAWSTGLCRAKLSRKDTAMARASPQPLCCPAGSLAGPCHSPLTGSCSSLRG